MRGEPAEGGGGGGGGGGQGEEEDRRQDCHSSLFRRFEATDKFLRKKGGEGRRYVGGYNEMSSILADL
jgi:hypothetical protein